MLASRAQALAHVMTGHPVRLARMMGYDRLTEPLHDGWIRRMAFGSGDWTLQAHRGSYKTTCVKVALWLLMVTRPQLTVGFFRKASPDVEEVMTAVARMLASDTSAMVTETIYGRPARVTSASSTAIGTDLACNVSDLPQLSGYGIGGSLTGKHYDVVFTDDVVTLRDRASRAERESTKAFYRELQNVRNRGGRIVNTGTPWHRDDAFSLMPEPERWDLSRTGLVSDGEAADLRASMTRSLFAANYELRHVADEGAVFEGEPETFSDPSLLFDGIMHVDAAYGGPDGTAVTCAAWHDGHAYVHGELFRETHVDRCLERILELHSSLRLGTVHLERNADKGYLARELEGMGLPVSTYQETANKHVKISTHGRGSWPSLLRYDSAWEASCAYWDEVMDYTEGASHDDAPDSLACAMRLHGDAIEVSLFRGGI
ncbi:hypothetical protein [Olsenella phocaeensis]|uniref:hypothetical protein n=1 Tax=Olsenella phocaeensis TaxID=1852385 RepID=UPI00093056DD|nr:hypothetical protein [Olsenella phocaeensis]